MAKRSFNYTNRVEIRREHVSYATREVSGGSPVAALGLDLESYDLPPDADVYAEAYRKSAYMRVRVGTVADRTDPFEFVLSRFDSPDDVKLRVKVVRHSDNHAAPILLAQRDRVTPMEGDNQDSDMHKLLSMIPADLNGEICRVSISESDGPVLEIEREYWDQRHFVRSGWCFPLVVPMVLREGIRAALADKYRELDEDTWKSRWLNLAMSAPVDLELPKADAEGEAIEYWINQCVEAFCRDQKMKQRIASHIEGGEA